MRRDVIENLGLDGTSSDETDTEKIGRMSATVYKVKVLPWRRDMEKMLKTIDQRRFLPNSGYRPQGQGPAFRERRVSTPGASTGRWPESLRAPPGGLPEAYFSTAYLEGLDSDDRDDLLICEENVQWNVLL
jgi:hypothetical protein